MVSVAFPPSSVESVTPVPVVCNVVGIAEILDVEDTIEEVDPKVEVIL